MHHMNALVATGPPGKVRNHPEHVGFANVPKLTKSALYFTFMF